MNKDGRTSPNAGGENLDADPDLAAGSVEKYRLHKGPVDYQPNEEIPISRPEFTSGFLRYLNNTQQDIARGLLSGDRLISPVFVSYLRANGFRTEQISMMTYRKAYELLDYTFPGQVHRLSSQNGSNLDDTSANERIYEGPELDPGDGAAITMDEARCRLIELRDTHLKRNFGSLASENGLLRMSMVNALLTYRPKSREDFISRIPQSYRLNTDKRQVDEFLEAVLSIVGRIKGE